MDPGPSRDVVGGYYEMEPDPSRDVVGEAALVEKFKCEIIFEYETFPHVDENHQTYCCACVCIVLSKDL